MLNTMTRKYLTGCVLMLVFMMLAPSVGAQDSALHDAYTIHPGDILMVSVWKEEDLVQEVLILPDGTFSFPLAGIIQAQNKSLEEIRTELTERLSEYIPELVVTVSVRQIGGNKIYVIGQVTRPGEFNVNPNVDVMQALSMAGGTTIFAETDEIRILRRIDGKPISIRFRYNRVKKGKDLEQNIMLEAGDVVVVP